MNKNILIIDDDKKLNNLLEDYLSKFNFNVKSNTNPIEGIERLKEYNADLIILDIMLPEMDGFETCRQIRKESNIPIIMLTARGDVTDRIVGLELGADDYLPKPFEPRELVARINSILKRSVKVSNNDVITFGPLSANFVKQSVKMNDNTIDFTTMEFELLGLFLKNPGRVMNRDFIQDTLKGYDYESFDRSIDVLLSRVRQKLHDDPKHPKWIRTVWGSGYKFIGEDYNEE